LDYGEITEIELIEMTIQEFWEGGYAELLEFVETARYDKTLKGEDKQYLLTKDVLKSTRDVFNGMISEKPDEVNVIMGKLDELDDLIEREYMKPIPKDLQRNSSN
jgi:hypothetical protein